MVAPVIAMSSRSCPYLRLPGHAPRRGLREVLVDNANLLRRRQARHPWPWSRRSRCDQVVDSRVAGGQLGKRAHTVPLFIFPGPWNEVAPTNQGGLDRSRAHEGSLILQLVRKCSPQVFDRGLPWLLTSSRSHELARRRLSPEVLHGRCRKFVGPAVRHVSSPGPRKESVHADGLHSP